MLQEAASAEGATQWLCSKQSSVRWLVEWVVAAFVVEALEEEEDVVDHQVTIIKVDRQEGAATKICSSEELKSLHFIVVYYLYGECFS